MQLLVVDDNLDVGDALALLLETLGHQVVTARDGRGALLAARKRLPDAALIDVGLPDMSGYDVARAIRSLPGGAGVVLLALTGHGGEEDRRDARAAGFDRHLVKPVDADDLATLIGEVAATHHLSTN